MSLHVYQSRINTLSKQLEIAKSDGVRAILLKQINDTKKLVREIKSEGAKQYFAELEAKYAQPVIQESSDELVDNTPDEIAKPKKAKKESE